MKISHRNSGELLEVKFDNHSWFKLLSPPSLSIEQSEALCRWLALGWDKMPQGESSTIELPQVFSQPAGESVCFYPGSFNPWHEGHSECVRQARKPLVIVPDANPWKDQAAREFNFSDVLELASKLPEGCSIYLGFIHLRMGNPTSTWLPQAKWKTRYLAMGADNFMTFEKWKDIEILIRSISGIGVIPRNVPIEDLIKKKNVLNKNYQNLAVDILKNHEFEDLASSAIKKLGTP